MFHGKNTMFMVIFNSYVRNDQRYIAMAAAHSLRIPPNMRPMMPMRPPMAAGFPGFPGEVATTGPSCGPVYDS